MEGTEYLRIKLGYSCYIGTRFTALKPFYT